MSNEHKILMFFIVLLVISHAVRTWQSREQIKNIQMIQSANLTMLAPLQEQGMRNATDIRKCHSRIEKLEDSLARFTSGWDLVEIDARRKGYVLPWKPYDKDKFYTGKGRDEYL
jgi:hypothetical protein